MIKFYEDTSNGYTSRTRKNVLASDITIAFAVNENTGGETQTAGFANSANIPFFSFKIDQKDHTIKKTPFNLAQIEAIVEECESGMSEHKVPVINVAGNGIQRFIQCGMTQERVDELVYNFLKYLAKDRRCNFKVRSGGQSGADEAGLKAGDKLGLDTICLAPKGWRFKDSSNRDIYNEEEFKKRFL